MVVFYAPRDYPEYPDLLMSLVRSDSGEVYVGDGMCIYPDDIMNEY